MKKIYKNYILNLEQNLKDNEELINKKFILRAFLEIEFIDTIKKYIIC